MRRLGSILVTLTVLASPIPLAASARAAGPTTERVNVTDSGAESEGGGSTQLDNEESVSADGRYVVYLSSATDLLSTPIPQQLHVYVRDRETGTTELITKSYTDEPANGASFHPAITRNGRYVAFMTFASDLIDPASGFTDSNAKRDVYLYDRTLDTMRIVSLSSSGVQGDGASERPTISADGRYVAFDSEATTLDPAGPDTNGSADIYLRDMSLNTTKRVSVTSTGTVGNGNNNFPSISDDGTIVAWASQASNLMGGRPWGTMVRDMTVASGWTLQVLPGNGNQPSISDDGRYIAYGSDSDLVANDTNGSPDVYRYDRQDASLDLVSIDRDGQAASATPFLAIDADGDSVSFSSISDQILPAGQDENEITDIFVWSDGTVTRASVAFDGSEADLGGGSESSISGDGSTVLFVTPSTNLLGPGVDTNGTTDVFVRVGGTPPPNHALTVTRTGSGSGRVTSNPVGVDCGATCSASFAEGTVVTLTAVPIAGSTFGGWTGSGCAGTSTCVLTMDQARSVTASFPVLPALTPVFTDTFDGTALDPAKWSTSLATSGVRWCSGDVVNQLTGPGLWQNVGTQPCHGLTAASPHGSVSVGGGTAALTAGTRRTFPYIWRGGAGTASPFPAAGDFVLETRLRFPSLAAHGTEFHVRTWADTTPTGNNPPGGDLFSIGACNTCGAKTTLFGVQTTVPGVSTAFHTYRLEYIGGAYSVWVDGVRTMGPAVSGQRPNAIWVGNPVFTHWALADWTDIRLDSVQVSARQLRLDVTKAGIGGGTVTSSPAGIDCGSVCEAHFDLGTQVTLSAAANGSSTFAGWSGAGCSGTATCVVTMSQARSVTATFTTAVVSADLSVSATATPDPATAGNDVTATVQVTNNGPDEAANVSATITLPASVVYASATPGQGSCSHASGTITCPLGSVPNGSTVAITVIGTPTLVGPISIAANVSTTTNDPTAANDSAARTVGVGGTACTIVGTQGNDTLTGTTGNDVMCGLRGTDNLTGGSGNDRLVGGTGADSLVGVGGNDDLLGGPSADSLNGGTGIDTARYESSPSAVTVNLSNGVAGGGEGADTLAAVEGIVGSAFGDTLTGDALANSIAGAAGNDVLAGLGGGDQIRGDQGNDTVDGGTESDSLRGGLGADGLSGGPGVDTVRYDEAPAGVQANLASGSASGGEGSDSISTVENLAGSTFSDTLTGDAGPNVLTTGAGADTLATAGGNDTLVPGLGDDTVDGGAGTDSVSYADATAGVVVNLSTSSASGGGGVDALAGIENIGGSNFDDVLTGDAQANAFDDLAGNDGMAGDGGNDLFSSDPGNDAIDGGAGIGDQVTCGVTCNVNLTTGVMTGSGTDTLSTVEAVQGSDGNDTIVGDGQDNFLVGYAGNDVISGGAGADRLLGLTGNDSLAGDGGADRLDGAAGDDSLDGGGGTDVAEYQSVAGPLSLDLTAGTATSIDGTDTFVATTVENILGSSFADTLTGSGVANMIRGLGGNDTISGLNGNDSLFGDAGDDTLSGGNDNDTLNGGAGANTLHGDAGTDTCTMGTTITGCP